MTTWDQQASTIDEAWLAVWAEHDQVAGIGHCMRMLAPLLAHLTPADAVLDLGAGIGRLAIPVAARGVEVWALDASKVMLSHLTDRCAHEQVGSVHAIVGDGVSIPRAVPRLDGAYSVVTLQHLQIDRQRGYIAAVAARLRLGGVFRFQVVTDTEPGPLSHPVANRDELANWCFDAGLEVEIEPDPIYTTWLWATAVKL